MSINIQEQVPLAPMTTFGIGGPARYFAEVSDEAEMREALSWTRERSLRFVVLAGGSNVLVPDEGIDGLVVRMRGDSRVFNGNLLEAHPGCNLLALIREAGDRGLGGWEKLAGIPGTIGGAVRGNAGAFGPEMKDFVERVRAFNTESGEVKDFSNAECAFSYRQSFFKSNPQWIILHVEARLAQAEPAESKRSIEETIHEREKRHIQNVRAAGSYFVNPVAPSEVVNIFEEEKQVKSRGERVPAGWLIEKAGMKGARVGGAMASEQHPNYLKNEGGATAADVRALAETIKKAVEEKFGVRLEEEAVIL